MHIAWTGKLSICTVTICCSVLEQEKGIYVYKIEYCDVALVAVLCDFAKQWLWDRLHFISMDNKFMYSCVRVFVEI